MADATPDVLQFASGNYIAQAAPGGTATVVHYEFAPAAPVAPARLDRAAELLAELPLDSVPPVGALPTGSHVPHGPNALFTGRHDTLRELAAALRGGAGTQPPSAAVTGIGGAGKTQLASEFAHRYGRYFDGGVFWLAFAEPSAIAAEISACGTSGRMELRPDFDTLSLEDRTRLVMSAWQSELPRLLVFDNCEDEHLVAQWRPPTGGCRVLVTSRRQEWQPELAITCLRVGTLDRSDSVALLRRYRDDLPVGDPAVVAIAEQLGDLPLALHLAGSHLWRYRETMSANEYSEQLRTADSLLSHRSLTEGGISPTGHEQHVARSFALSYERLDVDDTVDAFACELLAEAAYLAPGEVIPRELLRDTTDSLDLEDALRRLIDLGLMRSAPGGVRLHRLVALYARTTPAAPNARRTVGERLLGTFLTLHSLGQIRRATELEPHLRAVTDEALDRAPDELTRALCNRLGGQLRERGERGESVAYLEAAVRCAVELWGVDDPRLAHDLNDLGFSLLRLDALEGARECLEAALPRWQALRDAPNYAATLDNLGQLARAQNDSATAEKYFEDALEIREAVLGPKHERTAVTLANLGSMREARGDHHGAIEFYERALEARVASLGTAHPATALSALKLGVTRQEAGSRQGSRALIEQAVDVYSASLGPDDPATLSR